MTIDELINVLEKARNLIGGDSEVPIVRINFGENDYMIPEYFTIGEFVDQDKNKFKCALVSTIGGEEFTEQGTAHYKWKPTKFEYASDT